MKIRDVDAAVVELDEALSHYHHIHPALADALFQEVIQAKSQITLFPAAWKNLGSGIRGYVISHYPYMLVYQVRAEVIWVIAYAHHRRRPGYWKTRLGNTH